MHQGYLSILLKYIQGSVLLIGKLETLVEILIYLMKCTVPHFCHQVYLHETCLQFFRPKCEEVDSLKGDCASPEFDRILQLLALLLYNHQH